MSQPLLLEVSYKHAANGPEMTGSDEAAGPEKVKHASIMEEVGEFVSEMLLYVK